MAVAPPRPGACRSPNRRYLLCFGELAAETDELVKRV